LRPDHPRIATAALVGWFVGMLPWLAFVSPRSSFGALPAIALVALAVIVAARSVKADREATERPNLGEWLLGCCSCMLEGAAATLVALLFYGLGYGCGRLWNTVVDFAGWSATTQPSQVGLWFSIAMAAFLGLGLLSLAVEKLTRTLYPPTAGTRSVYYPLLGQRSKLFAFGGAVVVAIALVVLEPGSLRTTIIAAGILLYMATPLDDLAKAPRPRAAGLADEMAAVLESAGYAIVRSPRMGDPKIDPLIQNVTLLASAGNLGFAIEMTERAPNAPVEWSAASAVRTAAAVLQQQEMVVGGRHLRSVHPVLIVAGGTVSAGLGRFSEVEGVRLVHLQGTENRGVQLLEALGSVTRANGGEALA
jgi:hypothetical protein